MGSLNTHGGKIVPDEIFQAIMDMHDGLTGAESEIANAKLILMLAQEIGNLSAIREATDQARKNTVKWSLTNRKLDKLS